MRYWLGVVSRAHVDRGVAGGFAQLCHGKPGPLARMQPGDWLIYYSPSTEMRGGQRLQAFTALGQVLDSPIYRHDMGNGRVPFRRDLRYEPTRPVPIAEMADRLHLTGRPSWGISLRRGHLELTPGDFALIAHAMRHPHRAERDLRISEP